MQEEETPSSKETGALPAPAANWRHRAHLAGCLAVAIAASVLMGGAVSQGTLYRPAQFGAMPTLIDPAVSHEWKPVGDYVIEKNIKPAMLSSERLKYENRQIELANPPPAPALAPVKAPLLPGPVQTVVVPKPTPASAAFVPPSAFAPAEPVSAEQATEEVKAQPSREQKFNADLSTLEALQNALKALKAEDKTAVDGYSNNQ